MDGFDWQVEFAEVFAPKLADATIGGKIAGIVNKTGGQMELTGNPAIGGFDIVLTNPPYVRQELIRELKPTLKRIYKEHYSGTADLYVYFYLRARTNCYVLAGWRVLSHQINGYEQGMERN